MRPELRSLVVVDPPSGWEALGFVVVDGVVAFDRVGLRCVGDASASAPAAVAGGNPTIVTPSSDPGEKPLVESRNSSGSGVPATDAGFPLSAGLGISEVTVDDLDGIPLVDAEAPPEASIHPNGVIGIDHFVLVTPDFDRTAAACEAAGMPFRRVRDAGGFRQGFRRLGPAILEVVEIPQMPPGAARFWGLTFVASDLDALAERLGPERLRPTKEAVQPGRRIATLDRAAGLSTHVAFMTPESGQSQS